MTTGKRPVKGKKTLKAPTEMSDLADHLLISILVRVPAEAKKHTTLVCRKWYELDRGFTEEITIGPWGATPPRNALATISSRYPKLTNLCVCYTDMHKTGEQIDDASMLCLSDGFENLTELTLIGCDNITDAGIATIVFEPKPALNAVNLNRLDEVTGEGLLSLISGCPSLRRVQIEQLNGVDDLEWLEFIGTHAHIESLSIQDCAYITELGLALLGPRGWGNLREFSFSFNWGCGHLTIYSALLKAWKFDCPEGTDFCSNLETLSLSHCLSMPGTGPLWILAKCKALRKVEIHYCFGVRDAEMRMFTKNNPQLSSIHMKNGPLALDTSTNFTNGMLLAIAENCRCLESLQLVSGEGPLGPVSLDRGMIALVQKCKQLKALSLTSFSCLGNSTMAAIGNSKSLEELDFSACDFLTDGMLLRIGPNVTRLCLMSCESLTDACLGRPGPSRPVFAYLQVFNIPTITKEAALRAGKVVNYWWSDRQGRSEAAFQGHDEADLKCLRTVIATFDLVSWYI